VSTSSLIRVDLEREGQEVAEHWRQGMLFLDRGCSVGCDQPERTQRAFIQVWRLSLNHLDSHDTQRPDVNLSAIFLSRNNLGSHPIRGAYHGGTLVVALVDLSAKSEIGCMYIRTWHALI
jgi:hypothetical protein